MRRLSNSIAISFVIAAALLTSEQDTSGGIRAQSSPLVNQAVPDRYIILFRDPEPNPEAILARLRRAGAGEIAIHTHLGTAAVHANAAAARVIAADPAVKSVVTDRIVYAHAIVRTPDLSQHEADPFLRPRAPRHVSVREPLAPVSPVSGQGSGGVTNIDPADTFYIGSPQGWAVRAAGGYGSNFLGGNTAGPWNRSLGAGIRIAVLDSGLDTTHPDLKPNIALSLSEVDTAGQPSACDDGSPQDQQGHGTWVASLAAGAMGAGTGRVVGVAPKASLLNIKVLQRMPGSGSGLLAQCASGQASGLVSWLLNGLDDAVAQHADIAVLSLGSIVDLYTGDGEGLKAVLDRATHAATSAGVLVVAAAGNDGFDFGNPRYIELPAQARDVLAITASTNPACAENNQAGAVCAAGPVLVPYYANFGAPLRAIAAPGGNYPAGGDEAVSGWVRGACSSGKPDTADGIPSDGAHSLGCFDLGHTPYVQAMGTSASAGLAAGAAALLRAAHPNWTALQTAEMMRSTATPIAGGTTLLNTEAAMNGLP